MDNDSNKLKNGQVTEAISESRRKLTKAGLLAAPILTSLSARPVFGATQCLSNILSGNLSDPNRGQCNLGLSPGYWGQHPERWAGAGCGPEKHRTDGYNYRGCVDCTTGGSWDTSACSVGTETTLFNATFNGFKGNGTLPGCHDTDNRSMFRILCEDDGSYMFHIIAAYLNSKNMTDYVLTTQQVLDLWDGHYPEITDLKAFLNSTWT